MTLAFVETCEEEGWPDSKDKLFKATDGLLHHSSIIITSISTD